MGRRPRVSRRRVRGRVWHPLHAKLVSAADRASWSRTSDQPPRPGCGQSQAPLLPFCPQLRCQLCYPLQSTDSERDRRSSEVDFPWGSSNQLTQKEDISPQTCQKSSTILGTPFLKNLWGSLHTTSSRLKNRSRVVGERRKMCASRLRPAADNSSLASGNLISEPLFLHRKSPPRKLRACSEWTQTVLSSAALSTRLPP